MPSFTSLPVDTLHHVFELTTGFDLLSLTCVNKSLYRELSSNQGIWKKRLPERCSDKSDVKQSWKEQYISASSLRFQSKGRGGAVALPRDYPSLWQARPFTVDMWFCMATAGCDSTLGGVLLGAQSSPWSDVDTMPEYHQQIIHIDATGSLYCSVTNSKEVVASKLQPGRWYHVALTFSQSLQCVYLNGELVRVSGGPIHVEWSKIKALQLGNGFMTYGSKGRPHDKFVGWLGFNGLIDAPHVWDRVLSVGQVEGLAHGHAPTDCATPQWTPEAESTVITGSVAHVRCPRPLERHCIDI